MSHPSIAVINGSSLKQRGQREAETYGRDALSDVETLNRATPEPRSLMLGLVGAGISASLSPAMHEEEGRHQGLSLAYHIVDLERLALGTGSLTDLLQWAIRLGYGGLNITHPAKQAIMPFLDELTEDAQALGAVNTVVIRNGHTTGHNTDWVGFVRGLDRQLPDVATDRLVLVGAGGAGSAVAYGLLKKGAGHLEVFDIDKQRATDLVERLSAVFGPGRLSVGTDLAAAVSKADGLVHATPTGMGAHPGLAFPEKLIQPSLWFADVVYFPLESELVSVARSRGCAVAHGGGMAVFQAVDAFELFTGVAPDAERMLRHFTSLVARDASPTSNED
jgi:shikimate dehydrogenase